LVTAEKTVVAVEGHEITITNPDKWLWPEQRISKWTYIEKLVGIAPFLLPYCKDRYLTTIRYPNGVHGKSFYQKNSPEPIPPFVETNVLSDVNYVNLNSLPTLVWLANLACLEFHPSFHYLNSDLPAEWIIDIDPSLEVEPRIMDAALLVGEVLDSMRIQSIAKTSGATGIQIFVPIQHGYTFAQLRKIGHFISTYLVKQHPNLFTIERFKKNRGTHIYLDYLQHWPGKTLSAPYTPRARKEASVSTPLTWDEVEGRPDVRDFTLLNIADRLQRTGDLIQRVPPQNLDSVLHFLERRS